MDITREDLDTVIQESDSTILKSGEASAMLQNGQKPEQTKVRGQGL